jgi:hypothetical protein
MRARVLLGCLLVAVLGCGGSKKFASVSGKVTMNGKPLAGATVSFQPVAPEGAPAPGPGSVGKTDDNGDFRLETTTGQSGALVGPHRVSISLIEATGSTGDERHPPRGGPPLTEKISADFNSDSKVTFDVPSGGTNSANFDVTPR